MKLIPRQPLETANISRGQREAWAALKAAISIVVVLVVLYLLLGWIGVWLGHLVPDRFEKALSGSESFAAAEADTELLSRPQAILDKLTHDEKLRDLNYHLFLLDLGVPNAVAVPGGAIGVTKELLTSVKSEIGLAFVLAHELGHHQGRHLAGKLGRTLTLSLAFAAVFNGGDFSPVKAAINVAESGFSRNQEREADRFGMRLVHKHYGTTVGALEFFEQMQAAGNELLLQKYVGSHPLTSDRLKALRALQSEWDDADAPGEE